MSGSGPVAPAWEPCREALVGLVRGDPGLVLLEADLPFLTPAPSAVARLGGRLERAEGDAAAVLGQAASRASGGRTVFVALSADLLAAGGLVPARQRIARSRAAVKIVGGPRGATGLSGEEPPLLGEDLDVMRAVPGMTVAAPADGPSASAALLAVAARDGPAYVRLPSAAARTVTEGRFALGRAEELRSGSDLAIVAYGGAVARALDVAGALARGGVSARVLDVASLKPLDEAAVLRAARDTGAVLTMEEHALLGGIGETVAAAVAENAPVPVRRVGVPDVFVGSGAAELDRAGLGAERALDEAWELLRLRGKVQ